MHQPEPSWDQDWPYKRCLDDAPLSAQELDEQFDLTTRWPEPRLLYQTEVWVAQDRRRYQVEDLDGFDAEVVLRILFDHAAEWHEQAMRDEQLTLSSAMAWALLNLGVGFVHDFHPMVWLASTDLVRALQARVDDRRPKLS